MMQGFVFALFRESSKTETTEFLAIPMDKEESSRPYCCQENVLLKVSVNTKMFYFKPSNISKKSQQTAANCVQTFLNDIC
jgi:hypothetical protein